MRISWIATGLVAVALVSAAGIGYVAARPQDPEKIVAPKQDDQGPRGAVASEITVAAVQSRSATVTQQYVRRIHSIRNIEVRALAEGQITAIPVKEGQSVKKGDVMFEIGAILYKARLDADVADRDLAQLELSNLRKLVDRNVVSQDKVKVIEIRLSKGQARVDLSTAELNLTRIRAPFDGLVGRALRQEGSLVLKGGSLVSLSDNSSIWVDFNMPETRYLEYMAEVAQKKQDPTIELMLANNSKFPQAGKVGAIEPKFHTETGNIAFRADFPNPDELLHHGQAGTVVMNRVSENAIVIPQRVTFEKLARRYVYVVDKDKVAHQREILIGHEADDIFVIKNGVSVGDRIVVDGVRRVHDGERVE